MNISIRKTKYYCHYIYGEWTLSRSATQ